MRRFINQAAASGAAAVLLTTLCDQMRRAIDLMREDQCPPVFLFNLPATWKTSGALGLYIAELERLGRFLAGVGGTSPSGEYLIDVMLKHDTNRSELVRPGLPHGSIPLAILGGPFSGIDRDLLAFIEKLNGFVVLDATENGERVRPAPFERVQIRESPVTELARAYFSIIPDVFRRPNSMLYEWLDRNIQERKPRGIILFRQLWCDLWHAEVERIRDRLKLPLLAIDLNGQPPLPHNKTRIEAFMESLS